MLHSGRNIPARKYCSRKSICRELESGKIRQEKKERTYQAALQSFGEGDVSAVLSKLERLLELDRKSPDNSKAEQSATYQQFYEKVRTKRDLLDAQHAEAKRFVSDGNLVGALSVAKRRSRSTRTTSFSRP